MIRIPWNKGKKWNAKTRQKISRVLSDGRQSGAGNGRWKGGIKKDKKGYIYEYCPEHPFKRQGNYVFQHRLVMERFLGRYLLSTESVHHRDGNKQNNRIENLQLISPREHASLHAKKAMKSKRRDKKGRFIP